MQPLAWIIGGYFLGLIFFSFKKPKYFQGKAMYFLRSFFPSWKFFEDLGNVPKLFICTSADGKTFADWQPALPKQKRKLRSLFLNAEGNFLIACGSLLQQLESDIEELGEGREAELGYETSVTYQLIKRLVVNQISKKTHGTLYYQFKVVHGTEAFLVSPVYEV